LLDLLLKEYAEKFHENFPVFKFRGTDEDEIISIVEECITNDTPYDADDDGNDNW